MYKFALLRAIVQCVTEQRAHKRIDENPFARVKGPGEAGAGEGRGAPSTRETPSTRKQTSLDDGISRNRIHPDDGSASKPILPNAPYVISYPLGLLVYFWMFYYYPIFAHRVFIPQKPGDARRGIAGRNEIGRGGEFDPAIGSLKQISAYLIEKRGFPGFDL